ncbi:MAG TPA: hypothetical protein VEW93_12360 [Acidimicrobiales bacterium]|nr:hypothetical protein [Acidimicrobiales bacterium]
MPAPRPHPDEIVVSTSPTVRRRREARLLVLVVAASLPLALILWLIVNPAVAALFVAAWTLFFWFGIRRRGEPVLRLSPDGISYEPGQFHIRCTWADVDALGPVDLPDGRVEALILSEGHLHWATDAAMRRQVQARGWDRIVPIGSFEPEWEWGRIGTAFRQWAPWVFELEPPDAPRP